MFVVTSVLCCCFVLSLSFVFLFYFPPILVFLLLDVPGRLSVTRDAVSGAVIPSMEVTR